MSYHQAHSFKSVFRAAIVGLVLSLYSYLGHCEPKTEFVVGVEDYINWLPYSEYKNGQYGGLGKDILELYARHRGIRFRYEAYPLKRRDKLYVSGSFDFIFPDNPVWVSGMKQGLAIHCTPVLAFIDGMLVLPENKGKGLSWLQHFGMPLGFTPLPYFDAIKSGNILVSEAYKHDMLYTQVLNRRLDGIYTNVQIAKHYLRHHADVEEGALVFDPDLPHVRDHWYFSTIKHPEIVKDFKIFMEENQEQILDLKKRYGYQ